MDERWEIDHPLRPPNWRWSRALELIENFDRVPRADSNDKFVISAFKFGRKLTTSPPDRVRVIFKNEYLAWKIYSDETYKRLKWEIEARLIARQTSEEIGIRISVIPDVIDIYEKWFYNIRDRANNVGYLYNQLISPLVNTTPRDTDYEMLWKFYGLKADGLVLDSLIYGFCERAGTTDAQSVQAFWVEDYQETVGRKGAIAARLVKVDFNTFIGLLDHRIKLLESDRALGNSSGSIQDSILYNVNVALQQVPWLQDDLDHKTQISGVSLRTNELMQQHSPKFVELLESASYPVNED